MDTLTHIVVGGLIGEVYAGKSLGKRAMLIGAAAQSLPDIDFISSFWTPIADDLLVHRGFTHSILGAVIFTISLSFLLSWRHKTFDFNIYQWILLLGVEIFTHLFLDAFNNYGVGWFEPFNHARISFNTLFVADPLFTVWPAIIFAIIIFMKMTNKLRVKLAWTGLSLSALYLCYAVFNKNIVNSVVREQLSGHHIKTEKYFTTPTAFNTLLWYIVVEQPNGYYVGFRSIFDSGEEVKFNYYPQHAEKLIPFQNREDVNALLRFSQGYYTVSNYSDTTVFNDLRFGQIKGWKSDTAKFVFHYYLNRPEGNTLVIQRGRADDLSKKNLEELLNRIKGT